MDNVAYIAHSVVVAIVQVVGEHSPWVASLALMGAAVWSIWWIENR